MHGQPEKIYRLMKPLFDEVRRPLVVCEWLERCEVEGVLQEEQSREIRVLWSRDR